jgi:hypothetical protein
MRDGNWKSAARQDLEATNLSVPAIAAKYGRSASAVRKLFKEEGIKLRQAPKSLKRLIEREPLSSEHVRIGNFLTRCRLSENETKSSVANMLGISANKYGAWEAGRHDFTLSEVQRIGAWLGEDRLLLKVVFDAPEGRSQTRH